MPILLTDAILAAIRAHSEREYPRECCGALLGDGSGTEKRLAEARPTANAHEGPRERNFLIAPDEMYRIEMEARERRLDVFGFYHSHPDHPAEPSALDRACAFPGYSYVIVSVKRGEAGELRAWTLESDDSPFTEESIEIVSIG